MIASIRLYHAPADSLMPKRINELLRSNYSYLFSSDFSPFKSPEDLAEDPHEPLWFPILMEGKQRMVVWIGTTTSTSHLSLHWHCAILLTVQIF